MQIPLLQECWLENIRGGKKPSRSGRIFFMETSALDATNVETAFQILIRDIYTNITRKPINSHSYKPDFSINRVSLLNAGGSSKSNQTHLNFSCCAK
jgi:hypothetical protein